MFKKSLTRSPEDTVSNAAASFNVTGQWAVKKRFSNKTYMLEKLHTVALNLFTELFSSRDDATGLRSVLSLLRQREYFRSLSKLNTDYALMPHRGSDGCPCVCIISARARPVFVLGSIQTLQNPPLHPNPVSNNLSRSLCERSWVWH